MHLAISVQMINACIVHLAVDVQIRYRCLINYLIPYLYEAGRIRLTGRLKFMLFKTTTQVHATQPSKVVSTKVSLSVLLNRQKLVKHAGHGVSGILNSSSKGAGHNWSPVVAKAGDDQVLKLL